MADNAYRSDPGSGELIRTVDKSGVEAQVVILDLGGSGTESLLGDGGLLPTTGALWAEPIADGTINSNMTTAATLSNVSSHLFGPGVAPAFLGIVLSTTDACDADISITVDFGPGYVSHPALWSVLTGFSGPPADISTWESGMWLLPSEGVKGVGITTTGRTTGTLTYSMVSFNHAPLYEAALKSGISGSTDVSLASSATSAQVLAANGTRRGLVLTNTDANDCYLYYGTTAVATKFTVKIPSGALWEMPQPIYTGRIDAIWAADGSGSLIGSEL